MIDRSSKVAFPLLSVVRVVVPLSEQVPVQLGTDTVTGTPTAAVAGEQAFSVTTADGIVFPTSALPGCVVNDDVRLPATSVVELTGNCVSGTTYTCVKRFPERDDPVYASAVHVEGVQLAVDGVLIGIDIVKDCSGFSGDMLTNVTVVAKSAGAGLNWPVHPFDDSADAFVAS